MPHDAHALRDLFVDYLTPGLEIPELGSFRFHDAPPALVRAALLLVDPEWSTLRANGQPPAAWLIDAAERFEGRLAGSAAEPGGLRVDAVCVPGDRATELAAALDEAWPEIAFGGVALDLALAEGWPAWDAVEPEWTGNGRELLSGGPKAAVVGLWWD